MSVNEKMRHLPAVEKVMQAIKPAVKARFPREILVKKIQAVIEAYRQRIRNEELKAVPAIMEICAEVEKALLRLSTPQLKPVVNATGVVLHTNLGRAPLSDRAVAAVTAVARGYCNLELDLSTGKRGSRYSHVEELLCQITGAEAALVVNNNAAAVLLALSVLGAGKEVIISRSQLVEIGGSFRVPEVMAQSGCILKEVGATNKTKLSDYEQAIGPNTGLLLKVHTSNYRIVGFTQEVGLADLVELGKRYQLPVMEDLGSGFLVDLAARGIGDEPTVQASIAAGADVVTFSGDKLLGGPQAGIIVGKKSLLDKMKKHPLNRALRIDKMTVAALQATLLAYLEPEGVWQEIPTLRLLTLTADQIQDRAESLAASLRTVLHDKAEVQVVAEVSEVGGGAMPLTSLPTYAVRIKFVQRDCQLMAERLRQQDRPILVRIKDDGILLDLRTVLPGEEKMILAAFTSLMEGESR